MKSMLKQLDFVWQWVHTNSSYSSHCHFICTGEKNDPQHKTVSSSIAEVHGHDGSSGGLVKHPLLYMIVIKWKMSCLLSKKVLFLELILALHISSVFLP